MEEDFYDFEEDILNEMYSFITKRVDFYKKTPFSFCKENYYMIGDLIINSYCKLDSQVEIEECYEWIHNIKSNINILSDDTIPPIIFKVFRMFKKVVENVSDETIISWGLNANIVRSTLNSFDHNDSIEMIECKLDNIAVELEDFLLNKESFSVTSFINSIQPYMMEYMFPNDYKPIKDKDIDIIKWESIYFQTGIELVEKFKNQYYSWAVFYNRSYEDYFKICDSLSITNLKDKKYQTVHRCFQYYLLYMDDKLGVFQSYHKLADKNSNFSKYLRKATMENIYVRPLYYGYQNYCKDQNIEPNFIFDFDLLNEGMVCKVHFKNKTNEYYSSSDPNEALEFTIQKFEQLYEKFKSSGFIDEKTELEDFLFIFGLRESSKRDFHPIIWINPYNKKPGKELLIWTLKLLGYTEEEIKEGKPKLSIINSCFKQQFKHNDFPKTKKVLYPHEIGDDKNTILTIISGLKLGDDKWQTKFSKIQYELWNR